MEYKLKTNINCGGCIAAITPKLEGNPEIENWSVDIASPDKIATISTSLTKDALVDLIQNAGFKAEVL